MSNGARLQRFLVDRLSSSQTFRSRPIIDERLLTKTDTALGEMVQPGSEVKLAGDRPTVHVRSISVGARRCFVQGWVTHRADTIAPGTLGIALAGGSQVVRIPVPAPRRESYTSDNMIARFGFKAILDRDFGQGALDQVSVSLDDNEPLLIKSGEVVQVGVHCSLIAEQDGLTATAIDLDGQSIEVPAEFDVDGYRIGAVEWSQADQGSAEVWTGGGPASVTISLRTLELLSRLRRHASMARLPSDAASTISLAKPTGEVIAKLEMKLIGAGRGKLEVANRAIVAGWAVLDEPTRPADIDVFVNGIRYASMKADRARQDLKAKGISNQWGGFKMSLSNPTVDASQVTISASLSYDAANLPGSGLLVELPFDKGVDLEKVYGLAQIGGRRAVSVIVPVFNAFPELQLCIASILRCTGAGTRIFLINDCSTDPRIAEFLDGLASVPSLVVIHNEENLGFTKTVNKGLAFCELDDVILLNSDTIVSDHWVEGLRAAAYCGPQVATATPLSNNAGVYSVPEMNADNVYPGKLKMDDVADLVRRTSAAVFPRVPTGNGFCMFVRRDAIDAVGNFDEVAFPVGYGEENDFCLRCIRAGWEHVCDDRTFIFHKRSASFGTGKNALYRSGRTVLSERYPEYSGLIKEFETGGSMRGVRWRLREALSRLEEEGFEQRPRILFVISTLTGGTPQTNQDLMAALSDRYECWVLRCDSRVVDIGRFNGTNLINVESTSLKSRIGPAVHRLEEYNQIVFAILLRYAFRLVHIRHLGWHGLDLPALASRLGLPVIMSFHDYYVVCPSIKLLDRSGNHCAGTCTSDPQDCDVELWDRGDLPRLKHAFVYRWRENISSVFPFCTAFVTTSRSAKAVITANFPNLCLGRFHVIPHGRSFTSMIAAARPPEPNEPVRVLVPGNISSAKGALRLEEMLEDADVAGVQFHLLGDPGRLKTKKGLVCHGRYAREQFANYVREIRPALGVVLSTWPETYCHTLTEMWSCGVPVLGLDIGAVGERINAHGGGWLLPVKATASEILDALRKLGRNRAALKTAVQALTTWQTSYGRYYDTKYMAMLYEAIYIDAISASAMGRGQSGKGAVPKVAFVNVTLPNRVDYQWKFASLRLGLDWHAIATPAIQLDLAVVYLDANSASECAEVVRACGARGLRLVLISENRNLIDEVLPERGFPRSLFAEVLVLEVLGQQACFERLLEAIGKVVPSETISVAA